MKIIAEIVGTIFKRDFHEVLVKFPTAKLSVNFPTKLFQCKPTIGTSVLYQIVADEKGDVTERIISNPNPPAVNTEKKTKILELLNSIPDDTKH